MKRWMWLFTAALTASAAAPIAATAQADEKDEKETPTSLDKIPAPARDGMLREAAGAPILGVVQETREGKAIYEAHVRKGNDIVGIEVDPSGKLLRIEPEKTEKPHM